MALEFSGEVAELYQRYRHGYPPVAVKRIVDSFGLSGTDTALDLGCGTGQLAIALAADVGAVVGVDPEPDMLAVARRVAEDAVVENVAWMLGSDRSLPLLRRLLGDGTVGVLTVAQALHWMDHEALFAAAHPLLRKGGGTAILANGIPLWLQDTDWSRAAREVLARWLGHSPSARCGTDREAQERYAEALTRAGYRVTEATDERTVRLGFDDLLGGILSAVPASRLPRGRERERLRTELRSAVGDVEHFEETVPVVTILGRL